MRKTREGGRERPRKKRRKKGKLGAAIITYTPRRRRKGQGSEIILILIRDNGKWERVPWGRKHGRTVAGRSTSLPSAAGADLGEATRAAAIGEEEEGEGVGEGEGETEASASKRKVSEL